jgi:hypothetical protein
VDARGWVEDRIATSPAIARFLRLDPAIPDDPRKAEAPLLDLWGTQVEIHIPGFYFQSLIEEPFAPFIQKEVAARITGEQS